MFRGNHPTRVDEKGRLKLPSDFKRIVEEQYGAKFYLTSEDGRAAQIWPMSEWEKKEAQLALIPDMDPLKKKLMVRLNAYGREVEMDGQGRILIHPRLREKANLSDDVMVLGQYKYLEVINLEAHEKSLEMDWTDEERTKLAGYGV